MTSAFIDSTLGALLHEGVAAGMERRSMDGVEVLIVERVRFDHLMVERVSGPSLEPACEDAARASIDQRGRDGAVLVLEVLKGDVVESGCGLVRWEQNPERAWAFAEEQRSRGKITNPSVIGAFIHLGRCFDLARSESTAVLGGAHTALLTELAAIGAPVPVNRSGRGGGDDLLLRELDCAFLNFHLRDIDAAHGHGGAYYQTVRGVFVEGLPAFPGASIFTKTHTQVGVRDPAVIVGYFRPSRYTAPGA